MTRGERDERPAAGVGLDDGVERREPGPDLEHGVTNGAERACRTVGEALPVDAQLGLGDTHARARAAGQQQARDTTHVRDGTFPGATHSGKPMWRPE